MTLTALEASPYVQVLAEVNRRGLVAATIAARSEELVSELSGLYSDVLAHKSAAARLPGLDLVALDARLAAADGYLDEGQQFAGRIETMLTPYGSGPAAAVAVGPAHADLPGDHRVGELADQISGLARDLLTAKLPALRDGIVSRQIPVHEVTAGDLPNIAEQVALVGTYLRRAGDRVQQSRELTGALMAYSGA
ncbi:MAG: hypothetical protein ABW046_09515 [Actinoplanes sp.]